MRGVYIRDAYVEKIGRVHIFHDTESTDHFHYIAISSERAGRVRRSSVRFVKNSPNKRQPKSE